MVHMLAEASRSCCPAAEEEMTEFLQPLLERLGVILGSAPSTDVQAGALSAISSAAAAAGTGLHAVRQGCPGAAQGVHEHH